MKEVNKHDEEVVQNYKEDIDTLLVFVRTNAISFECLLTNPLGRFIFRCPHSVCH